MQLAHAIERRRFADLLLFSLTAAEFLVLVDLTPTFSVTDWIYLSQHIVVLAIALTRPPPKAYDHSLSASAAVFVAYAYPYAQLIYLRYVPGNEFWPEGGIVVVTTAAVLSLLSLLTLGKRFGLRPALRGLATSGPYEFVRHPMYLSYVLGDIGYNLQEWNLGTLLLTLVGWASLLYRIQAEEQVLAQDSGWTKYAATVRSRLIPGVW